MPHLQLEYTSNLPAHLAGRELFVELHEILERHGVAISNCKSRAIERPVYLVGDGTRNDSFVHLDVRLLEGRTEDVKRSMGDAMLEALRKTFAGTGLETQITVEIRDIVRSRYFKHPPGTI